MWGCVKVICSCMDSIKTRRAGRNNDGKESSQPLLYSLEKWIYKDHMDTFDVLSINTAPSAVENMLTVFMCPVKGCSNNNNKRLWLLELWPAVTINIWTHTAEENPHKEACIHSFMASMTPSVLSSSTPSRYLTGLSPLLQSTLKKPCLLSLVSAVLLNCTS